MNIKILDIENIRTVKKPWGYERWISDGEPNFKYVLKEIFFRSTFRTSTQVHKFKEETNYILSGKGILFYSEENFDVDKYENNEYSKEDISKFLGGLKKQELTKGKVVHVKPGCIHRIESLEDLTIIESSTIELDDVIRLEDDTDRPNGKIKSEHLT
jgi:mannose-6-phosphate isomerase|tara:strand:- start:1353 stop:1823 length:471 start_codon:yes stop_codon:yes gene_type:complete